MEKKKAKTAVSFEEDTKVPSETYPILSLHEIKAKTAGSFVEDITTVQWRQSVPYSYTHAGEESQNSRQLCRRRNDGGALRDHQHHDRVPLRPVVGHLDLFFFIYQTFRT